MRVSFGNGVEVVAEAINRWWRVVATGFCFAVFGLGGLVVRCVFYPLLILLVKDPERRIAISQSAIHYAFKWFVALMAGVGVLTYEVRGMEKLQRHGLLVLANHPSLIDVVFLISFIEKADCIVKEQLMRNPFTRGPIRAAGFITNNSGPGLIDDCIRSLRSGNNLVIFPEGTRTPISGSVRLQRGAANVAVRGALNITPVHIQCSRPMLTKGVPWWKVPARRPHFTIEVREDIEITPFCEVANSEALAARQLTDYLSEQLFRRPVSAST